MSNLLKATLAAAIFSLVLPLDSFAQQAGGANGQGGSNGELGGHQPLIINRAPNRSRAKPFLPNTCQCTKRAGKTICKERVVVNNSYMYKICQRS